MILHQSWIFLFTILVLTVGAGLLTVHFKDTGIFEGLTEGPTGTTRPTGWVNNTNPPNNFKFVYSIPYEAIIAVIDPDDKVVDYNNNIIGTVINYVNIQTFVDNYNRTLDTTQVVNDANGVLIGIVINSDDLLNRHIMDENKNILGVFTEQEYKKILYNGRIVGVFNNDGSLRSVNDNTKILGFSLKGTIITPKIMLPFSPVPRQTNPLDYFNGDFGNMGGDENDGDFDNLRGRLRDYYSSLDGKISIVNNDRNNLQMQNGLYRDYDDVASFNYDLLYDTDNLSPKYSFTNSSFFYKSYLTDENDYLNEVYFNKNPLELENMCKKLDNTTCGLTSTCVFVGNDKCLPGNKRGPYTVYSDINLDYYYYKGKCYGNCPGKFYPGGGDDDGGKDAGGKDYGKGWDKSTKNTTPKPPPNNTTAIPSTPNNTTTRQ